MKDNYDEYGSFEEWEDEEYEPYEYEKKKKAPQKPTGSCCFVLLIPISLMLLVASGISAGAL